jgi:hypothetical protein
MRKFLDLLGNVLLIVVLAVLVWWVIVEAVMWIGGMQ